MKREKTVVEIDLSEEKQREIVSSLIREHTSFGKKFERERTRQEDMVSNNRVHFSKSSRIYNATLCSSPIRNIIKTSKYIPFQYSSKIVEKTTTQET
jgi:hypothetical protein